MQHVCEYIWLRQELEPDRTYDSLQTEAYCIDFLFETNWSITLNSI
jgi:hypothetical protein